MTCRKPPKRVGAPRRKCSKPSLNNVAGNIVAIRELHGVIGTLLSETGDTELTTLFGVAGDLHMNFYENRSKANVVGNHLQQVERFVDKAEALLEAPA